MVIRVSREVENASIRKKRAPRGIRNSSIKSFLDIGNTRSFVVPGERVPMKTQIKEGKVVDIIKNGVI